MFVEDGSRPPGGTEAPLTDAGFALLADPTFIARYLESFRCGSPTACTATLTTGSPKGRAG
jgi:hypothetical protein